MPRASTAISLLLAGSAALAWSFETDRRDRQYAAQNQAYPTTYPSGTGYTGSGYPGGGYYSGGHYYYYPTHSSGWFGPTYGGGSYSGGSYTHSSGFSGVERGGFGSIGHSLGGHS